MNKTFEGLSSFLSRLSYFRFRNGLMISEFLCLSRTRGPSGASMNRLRRLGLVSNRFSFKAVSARASLGTGARGPNEETAFRREPSSQKDVS